MIKPKPKAGGWRLPWSSLAWGTLIVLGVVIIPFGYPVWAAAIVAAIPWFLAARRRYTAALAGPIVVLAALWLALMLLIVTAVLTFDILSAAGVLCVAVGLAGTVVLARTPAGEREGTHSVGAWVSPLAGPVALLAAAAYSATLPRGERLGWALANDSANNLIFARETIYRGGTAVGALENPVPLPSTVFTLAILPGRDGTPPSVLLEHDIAAFATLWVLIIALVCYLVGLVVSTTVRRTTGNRVTVAVAGAVASAVPLSWVFSGYPMEYGFFSIHLALPILLACWALYVHAPRSIALALCGLLLATTLILAVWSPLIVIPLSLIAALIAGHWRSILRIRGSALAVVVFGVAQLILYGVVVVLPVFLGQRGALAGAGGIYRIPEWAVFAAGLALGACAWLVHRRWNHDFLGVVGLVTAGWGGIAVLLYISRRADDPWTYYPLKLAWLLVLLYLVLLAMLVAVLVSRVARRGRQLAVALGAGVLLFALFAWLPPTLVNYTPMSPIQRLLGLNGAHSGAAAAERVFALADPESASILWESDLKVNEEGYVNSWLTLLWADSLTKNADLRLLGLIAHTDKRIEVVCQLGELMGPGLTVHTSSKTLAARLDKACPNVIGEVLVGRPGGAAD